VIDRGITGFGVSFSILTREEARSMNAVRKELGRYMRRPSPAIDTKIVACMEARVAGPKLVPAHRCDSKIPPNCVVVDGDGQIGFTDGPDSVDEATRVRASLWTPQDRETG